jgi:uncharacterized protein with ParB-like and HNH nuclease domain
VSDAKYLKYQKRKINIKNENITNLIHQLSLGKFLVPTFQRFFVWDPEAICSLWDSIYHCYPIGSILYWKTRIRLHVHRKFGGFFIPENNETDRGERFYILDGQQRLTSLLVSFKGGKGKIRDRLSFDYTLYFDLARGTFFFEKDYYRHRWDAEAAFLIRLRDVPNLPLDHERELAAVPGFSPVISRNYQQLKYLFVNYSLPMICLENYDIPSVCAVYERINRNGVKLDNLDILIARSFKNDPTVVDEDFPVIQ